jgi:hypothetical protein
MKVAYVFSSTTSQKILNNMIIPQLEADTHGADVAGGLDPGLSPDE